MATKNSEEIAQLLWKYSLNDKKEIELTHKLPDESLATKMVIAWCLSEVKSEFSKEKRSELIGNLLHYGFDKQNDDVVVKDVNKLYELIDLKRANLKSPINDYNVRFDGLMKFIDTLEAQNLGLAIRETDLYDWWNIMMEYASVGVDGKVIFA